MSKKLKTELTENADTREQGLVIWLNTKSEKRAYKKSLALIKRLNAQKGKK